MAAVKQNGWALQDASKDLQANLEIVMAAVKQDGLALQYASPYLRANPEIVMAAVKQNGGALYFASEALRNGGLKSYVQSALSKFNTPMRVFVDLFLCSARLLRFPPVALSAATY